MRPRIRLKGDAVRVSTSEETSVIVSDESETNRTQLSEAYNRSFEINETELEVQQSQLNPDEKLEIMSDDYDYKLKYELEYVSNRIEAYNPDIKI
jgi:hypothetical protein